MVGVNHIAKYSPIHLNRWVSPLAMRLFIGDSVEDDVVGAIGAGIDVAWINATAAALPDDVPPPTFTLKAITELESILT